MTNQSPNYWIGQFALRLMELRPGLIALDAVKCAVSQCRYSDDMEPEYAVAAFLVSLANLNSSRQRTRRGLVTASP
jgi:hypothetical protein